MCFHRSARPEREKTMDRIISLAGSISEGGMHGLVPTLAWQRVCCDWTSDGLQPKPALRTAMGRTRFRLADVRSRDDVGG